MRVMYIVYHSSKEWPKHSNGLDMSALCVMRKSWQKIYKYLLITTQLLKKGLKRLAEAPSSFNNPQQKYFTKWVAMLSLYIQKSVSRPILLWELVHNYHFIRVIFVPLVWAREKGPKVVVSRSDLLRESGWWAHCKHKNTLMHFDALDQVQRLDCQKFKHFHFVISNFFKLPVQASLNKIFDSLLIKRTCTFKISQPLFLNPLPLPSKILHSWKILNLLF